MEFLGKRNTSQVSLIDLSSRGDDTVDPKRGIDDFLAYSGTWADAMALRIDELPERPVDDSGEKGQTRVTPDGLRSEEHTSELQSRGHLVCRLLLEKKNRIRR